MEFQATCVLQFVFYRGGAQNTKAIISGEGSNVMDQTQEFLSIDLNIFNMAYINIISPQPIWLFMLLLLCLL
jgi:hypothetical protein